MDHHLRRKMSSQRQWNLTPQLYAQVLTSRLLSVLWDSHCFAKWLAEGMGKLHRAVGAHLADYRAVQQASETRAA